MADKVFNLLVLCTGNTARSILAEAILRKLGEGRFNAYSAGSQPKGVVNPFALKVLEAHGYPTDGLRSKSWEEFSGAHAPRMDFIVTVCDNAAGEACPLWPGQPITAHWGIEDPAAATGSDREKTAAFEEAFRLLSERIAAFVALPIEHLDALKLEAEMRRIGRFGGVTAGAAKG